MNPFGNLFGRYVRAIFVDAETQDAMRFDVGYTREPIYVGTDAGCCSETWFADIVGVGNLLGAYVSGIVALELPTPTDDRTRQESDEAYGIRLTTAKGDCDIIYRNSSNGYYGGSAEAMSAEQGQKRQWLAITEDWQA